MEKLKVLIVEDKEKDWKLVKDILEEDHLEVIDRITIATSYSEAVQALAVPYDYDLSILDVKLPAI